MYIQISFELLTEKLEKNHERMSNKNKEIESIQTNIKQTKVEIHKNKIDSMIVNLCSSFKHKDLNTLTHKLPYDVHTIHYLIQL